MEQRARAKTPGMNPQSFKTSAINLTAGGSNIERQDTFSAARDLHGLAAALPSSGSFFPKRGPRNTRHGSGTNKLVTIESRRIPIGLACLCLSLPLLLKPPVVPKTSFP